MDMLWISDLENSQINRNFTPYKCFLLKFHVFVDRDKKLRRNGPPADSPRTKIYDDISKELDYQVLYVNDNVGFGLIPPNYETKDFFSNVVCGVLKPLTIVRGRVTCLLTVKPAILNFFGGVHGGAVAAVAEAMSIACARTIVTEDKEIFLGELSMSYLSSATKDAEVIVTSNIVRSGRNLTIVAVDFKLKPTEKLVYRARATFFNIPVAKL